MLIQSIKAIFDQKIRLIFLLIISAELLSFLGYYYQWINFLGFFAISLAVIILSLYKLEYGIFVLLAELFIGSFGYLFYFQHNGTKISLRLALWLIILSVWLAKTILAWIRNKKLSIEFFKSNYFNYFFVLFIFVVWGLINGILNGNLAGNIFSDFQRWLYFLLIFPIFSMLQNQANIKTIKQIFLVAITWLSAKTLILLYVFSHNFNGFIIDIYKWVRMSGVGEITQVQGGFNRIFMQSQIFILIGIFIILFYILKQLNPGQSPANKKLLAAYLLLLALFIASILISFSRSFWVGLAVGGVVVWLIAIFKLKIKIKQFFIFNSLILSALILSLALIFIVVFFPFPSAYGGFNATDLLSERATEITGEAGASSRWQLLPPLVQKIQTAFIMGRGFGATVTYKSSDPRVLVQNSSGEYTTYAFEWGWLDVWLKLGLCGLLAYLCLFAKIIFDGFKNNSYFALSLTVGLIVLMAVNIFSPYVNHPLGIGCLMIIAMIMRPDLLREL